ncbi:MAG: 50S ribosomal protein L28 [Candidatus Methylomirabilales bacterium]|nr:50S ribosomal protein L28 [candidate division NC10 bacterium]
MKRRCEICAKGPKVANRISHAHNVTKRRQFPNIHRVHVLINHAPRYIHVCTRCLRSGKVQKAS